MADFDSNWIRLHYLGYVPTVNSTFLLSYPINKRVLMINSIRYELFTYYNQLGESHRKSIHSIAILYV